MVTLVITYNFPNGNTHEVSYEGGDKDDVLERIGLIYERIQSGMYSSAVVVLSKE